MDTYLRASGYGYVFGAGNDRLQYLVNLLKQQSPRMCRDQVRSYTFDTRIYIHISLPLVNPPVAEDVHWRGEERRGEESRGE